MDMFLCEKDSRGSLQASGRDCTDCKCMTYSAFKLCLACAVSKEVCQKCGQPKQSHLDSAQRVKLRMAILRRRKELKKAQTALDQVVDPIGSAVAVYDSEREAARMEYEAAIKPAQTKFLPYQSVDRMGADQDALDAAERARTEFWSVQKPLSETMQTRIKSATDALGETNTKNYHEALQNQSKAKRTADRTLDKYVENLLTPPEV